MIVADLFRAQLFPDFKLLGGTSGLNKKMLSVSVIDAPDVDRWMRGGEFVVGSGYIFKDNPLGLIPFMERASLNGAVAFGIKLDRYHHDLTDEIRACADRIGLPLLNIPLSYRWTDIIDSVYSYLHYEKGLKASKSAEGTNYWENGLNAEQLLSDLARKLERKVIAVSLPLGLSHLFLPSGESDGNAQVQDFLEQNTLQEEWLPSTGDVIAHLELRNPSKPQWVTVFKASQENSIALYLCHIEGEYAPSTLQMRLLLRAMTLLRSVALEKESLTPKSGMKAQRFFEELCLDTYTDRDMIRANLDELKIFLPASSRVAIVTSSVDNTPPLHTPPNAVLSYTLGNSWVGLIPSLPADESGLPQLAEKHCLLITQGPIVRDVLEISRSFQGARRTLKWVSNFLLPPGCYLHDSLSLFALLESMSRFPEAMDVWRYYWKPLVNEEKSSRRSISLDEFVHTLVQCDFNAKLCSDQLHLHYNTVRNYMTKISELLGLDLTNSHHRLGLTLAFHINRSLRTDRSGEPVMRSFSQFEPQKNKFEDDL